MSSPTPKRDCWTAEPWEAVGCAGSIIEIRDVESGSHMCSVLADDDDDDDERTANAARIVACVNEFAGMEDPAETIRELAGALQLAVKYLQHPDVQSIPFALSARAAEKRARAALAKLPR